MDSDGRTPHPPTHYSHPASSQPTSHPESQTVKQHQSKSGCTSRLTVKPRTKGDALTCAELRDRGEGPGGGEGRDGELTARCREQSRRQGPRLTARLRDRGEGPGGGEGRDGRRGARRRAHGEVSREISAARAPAHGEAAQGPGARGGPRRTARASADDEAAARARSQARSNWKLHVRRNEKRKKDTDGRVRDLGTFKLQTACLTGKNCNISTANTDYL